MRINLIKTETRNLENKNVSFFYTDCEKNIPLIQQTVRSILNETDSTFGYTSS